MAVSQLPWEAGRQHRANYNQALASLARIARAPDELPPEELAPKAHLALDALAALPNREFMELVLDAVSERARMRGEHDLHPLHFVVSVGIHHLLGLEHWAEAEVLRRIVDAGRFGGGREAGDSQVIREVSALTERFRLLLTPKADAGLSNSDHLGLVSALLAEALAVRGHVVRDPSALQEALKRKGHVARAHSVLAACGHWPAARPSGDTDAQTEREMDVIRKALKRGRGKGAPL